MKYYPAYLDLQGRSCLVVGGGAVAERKVHSLLSAGALLTVVSPEITPVLRSLADRGSIRLRDKSFDVVDVTGFYLVVAATNDAAVNSSVARACRTSGILVNTVTNPEESSFIVPSVVERGDLLIAVSTGGASPALARKIREDLEALFGPEYRVLLENLELLRTRLFATVPDEETRRSIFQAVVDSDVLTMLKRGDAAGAEQKIEIIVKELSG
ncbi:MAG: bifunctional precorrin-2 dehydrogenase/sirohydrochlorin ferrochelatase [Nitrospiraceae bacterium]|nr:bifunctional precorrin-2 dehydrogenase/sirohydrochlorin ferrochelatase [Nitrospiraceae bacterium]